MSPMCNISRQGVSGDIFPMRVTVAASASTPNANRSFGVPVTVKVRPSCGVPGEHSFTINSHELKSILRRDTELSGVVIDCFMDQLSRCPVAKLPAITLADRTLREVGYFIDELRRTSGGHLLKPATFN